MSRRVVKVAWDEIMCAVKHLADLLDTEPTAIVGIGRGGLPILTAMASYLNVPRVGVVIVSVRASGQPFARRIDPVAPLVLLPPTTGHDSVLLVDDIVRTGQSMRLARDALIARQVLRVETAAIFGHTGPSVDHVYADVGARTWVEFPWDRWDNV